jgi:hypothetical protein
MMRLRLAIVAVLILLALMAFPPAHADYSVQLQGDTFRVTWTMNAFQNLTELPDSATVFPQNLSYSLTGADLSQFSSAIQTSLQQKVSGMTVSDASLSLSSNSINTTCAPCFQTLNATATFLVHEPAQTRFGVAQYDMSWMALRLNDDLAVVNTPYNRLGQDYLLTAIQPFVNFVTTSDRTQLMQVNRQTILKIGYQPIVGAIVLFDMSALTTPLEDWKHSMSLDSQTWTSPENGGFNFTATQHFVSENAQILYLAGATVSAQFSAPLNAVAKGDMLTVDLTGGVWDQTGLAIILASIGVLATTVIIDRRLTGTYGQKRRRSKN